MPLIGEEEQRRRVMGHASDSGERRSVPLSENSTVRLGLVVLIVGYVFGTAWWAATMNAKVDSLITMASVASVEQKELQKQVDELKERVWKLEVRTAHP